MTDWQLAQLNIATLIAPIDSPALADFVANLDRINALADSAPGFVWRLKEDLCNSSDADQPFGDDKIVNMSVWESVESLHNYVYRTAHAQIMSRRKEWFERMSEAYSVLWWVPAGHQPDLLEAKDKLDLLRHEGAGSEVFTFKSVAPQPVQVTPR
ncbi:MAG: DUF3291 domain-containing protein [Granulosicoccus sp.]